MNIRTLFILFLLSLFLPFGLPAQQGSVWVSGTVTDEENDEPLPLVSVVIKGTHTGTTTDDNGFFKMKIPDKPNVVLLFKYMGYEQQEVKIRELIVRKERTIVVKMKPGNALNAIVVKPGENPAFPILRNIIAFKAHNNPARINAYKTQEYAKSLVQLKNITKSALDSNVIMRSLKQSLIYQHDSTERYTLPLLFTEELKETIHRRDPQMTFSISKGKHSEGLPVLENADITADYISIFSKELNFYNDNLLIQNTPLVSPISSLGMEYYDFKLVRDTVYSSEYGLREYRIKFKPKNPRDAAFTGELTVYDSLFALKKIAVKLSPQSNVAYIIRYEAEQDYTLLNDSISFVTRSRLDLDAHIWKFKDGGVHGALNIDLTNYYSNVELNPVIDQKAIDNATVVVAKPLTVEDLLSVRKDTLSVVESRATVALRDLNKIGWVKFSSWALEVIGSGYMNVGKVDFGPYPEILKMNGMEGFRMNVNMRTSNTFHPNFFADWFVGYGTKDARFKGGLDVGWKFPQLKRRVITVGGKYDSYRVADRREHLLMLRESAMSVDEDMLFITLFAQRQDERYTMRYGGHISYEHEWSKSLTGYFRYENYFVESGQYTPFTTKGTPVSRYNQQELSVHFRMSSDDERQSDFLTRRVYLGNGNLPIVHLELAGGRYILADNLHDGYYGRAHAAVKHFINIGTMQLRYMLEMGVIMGAVPFPVLEGHRSVESWAYSPFKFDLLYNYAVASDMYTSLLMEYNLNGLLFNRIPLIRDLNIKEMLSFKLLYSFCDRPRHNSVLDMPDYMYAINSEIPYMEIGVGVKNIFQFFGIGCVWNIPAGRAPYAYSNFSIIGRFSFEL